MVKILFIKATGMAKSNKQDLIYLGELIAVDM